MRPLLATVACLAAVAFVSAGSSYSKVKPLQDTNDSDEEDRFLKQHLIPRYPSSHSQSAESFKKAADSKLIAKQAEIYQNASTIYDAIRALTRDIDICSGTSRAGNKFYESHESNHGAYQRLCFESIHTRLEPKWMDQISFVSGYSGFSLYHKKAGKAFGGFVGKRREINALLGPGYRRNVKDFFIYAIELLSSNMIPFEYAHAKDLLLHLRILSNNAGDASTTIQSFRASVRSLFAFEISSLIQRQENFDADMKDPSKVEYSTKTRVSYRLGSAMPLIEETKLLLDKWSSTYYKA